MVKFLKMSKYFVKMVEKEFLLNKMNSEVDVFCIFLCKKLNLKKKYLYIDLYIFVIKYRFLWE